MSIIENAITPVTQQVTEPETVKSQLTNLLSSNSKYVEQARDRATANSASRGLINSSIAAGAGERAAIDAALPIAQQDATTYANQNRLNQTEANKFNLNAQATQLNTDSTLKINEQQHAQAKDLEAQQRGGLIEQEKLRQAGASALDTQQHQNTMERATQTYEQDVNKLNVQHTQGLETLEQQELYKQELAELQNILDIAKEGELYGLKEKLEMALDDNKLVGDLKIQYVQSATDIVNSVQTTIGDIGLSGRPADQQAAAIEAAVKMRDEQLTLLKDMIPASADWEWFSEAS